MELRFIQKHGDIPEVQRTHPASISRYNKLKEMREGKNNSGMLFQVDREAFNRLRKISRYEQLHLLARRGNPTKAATRAIQYYIQDPEDEVYIYYLAETARQYLYLYPDEIFKLVLRNENIRSLNHNQSIFSNPKLLSPYGLKNMEEEQSYITEVFHGDNISWYALTRHLSDQMQEKNIAEGMLCFALLYHQLKTKEIFNKNNSLQNAIDKKKPLDPFCVQKCIEYSDKYIQAGGKYPEYAHALKTDSLLINAGEKRLLLFNDIMLLKYSFNGGTAEINEAMLDRDRYVSQVKYLADHYFDNLWVEDLRDDKIKLSVIVNMLDNYSCYRELQFYAEDEVNMFIYNPETWVFFNKYKLNSLEMMSAIGLKDNTAIINRMLYYLLPTSWVAIPIGVFGYGSKKHKYQIRYSYLRPFENIQTNFELKTVDQKMRKLMFRNSVYHLLKDNDTKKHE